MKNKVTFKELSWPVKAAVIAGWFVIAQLMFLFVYGFFIGFVSGL